MTSQTVPSLQNPGFESGLSGWNSAGKIEPVEGSGMCLTHAAGQLETTQTLTEVPDGWYTLRVRARTSGGRHLASIALTGYGGGTVRAAVPPVRDAWLQVVVSAHVTGGTCTVCLTSDAAADEWASFDDVEFAPGRAALSIMGADISSLPKSEALGGAYAYEDGTPGDALQILQDHGLNYARLRVWVNSPDGYHGQPQLLAMAKRLKARGIRLLVDFHYADSWADPGKQPKPAAWSGLDFAGLKQALYDHTFGICSALAAQGTPPDMVQIGNEITNGLLWPDGKNDENFDNLVALLKEGRRAIKACSPATQVMIHLDNGGNNAMYRHWFDSFFAYDMPFDLIGVSYYPYWHGTLADLQNNLNDIAARYGKDIVLVETSYAFTSADADGCENIITNQEQPGYPFTPEGQRDMLADVMSIVRAVPGGRGLGVMWWDATWTAVPGNGWDAFHPSVGNNWENQALFDFDFRALPAMKLFRQP